MKAKAPPTPPDATMLAQQQAKSNLETAQKSQQMNMIDQSTPYGNLSWSQTGTWEDGTPKYSASTTLSPEEQRSQEQQWTFDDIVNRLGISQAERLSGHLDQPIQLGNEATEGRLMELGRKRLDPVFSERRSALENKLYNQGVMPGSEAYAREMRALDESENDAYNQLLLTGRGQANQELLTERNQPINEITALMAGGQVTQPNFVGTPSTNVSGVDTAGLAMDAYKMGPMAQWQANEQNRRAMLEGGTRIASAALGGWAMSDRRLKENVRMIGRLENGLSVYAFNYIGHGAPQIGLMADEVEMVKPHAVRDVGGYKAVYYPEAIL